MSFPKFTAAVEDAVAYPILTKDVGSSAPSTNGSRITAPGGGTSLLATAQSTIRQALGWRYRADDTKGFVAALKKSFVLKDVEGHTEWDYNPQSYAVSADMGEITGAQASIYARAKNALEQTQPLLDGLTPLLPDPDYEDIEAMRSIVRDEITQLVIEFGQVAGPRVQRVDSIFNLLISGPKPDYRNPERIKGHLGQLGRRLGMERRMVNTIEDEQDLTNFLMIVDYINSLKQTWVEQKEFFTRGKGGYQPFLGPQLVLISQALASVTDQMQDTWDAMDSVYLGAAERQTLFLDYYKESAPITLEELLNWGMDFATNEGPKLLQESGKDGVVAFRSTANRLDYLLYLTLQLSKSDAHTGGRPFHTYRVQVALEDLYKGYHRVDSESNKIQRDAADDDRALTAEGAVFRIDSLLNVYPDPNTNRCLLTVGGKNIRPGTRMMLISTHKPAEGFAGTAPSQTEVTDLVNKNVYTAQDVLLEGVMSGGTFMTAAFTLPAGFTFPAAHIQHFTLAAVSPEGAYAWLERPFSQDDLPGGPNAPSPVPQIYSVFPRKSRSGGLTVYRLTLKGDNFEPDVTLTFAPAAGSVPIPGGDITVSTTVKSSKELEVVITNLAPTWMGTVSVANAANLGNPSNSSKQFKFT
jgi:hypothetical protein